MVDHHLIKKSDIGGTCVYCNKALDANWVSSFSSETHYKCIVCTCGKANCTDVSFIGTGHDSWSELEKKVVKSSVKIIEKSVKILR